MATNDSKSEYNPFSKEGAQNKVLIAELLSRKPSSDYLNAVFDELLTFYHIVYGFVDLEQGDWVHPEFLISCVEKKELPTSTVCSRPLNSWALKGPAIVIPSEEELENIVHWHYIFFARHNTIPWHKNILEAYVDSAFAELETRRKM